MLTIYHFTILSIIIFTIGTYGVLSRKSVIQIYMSIELMFNAINLNIISFAHFNQNINFHGHVFVLFIITLAAIETAVGLAIVVAFYKHVGSLDVEKAKNLKY